MLKQEGVWQLSEEEIEANNVENKLFESPDTNHLNS